VAERLLEIRDLSIEFAQPRPAVNGIDLDLDRGEILALVGESGSGKSMTARAILGLLPRGARARGSIRLEGQEVLGLSEKELNRFRGERVAMVFQEPQTALNPVRTVGWQIREALRAHRKLSRSAARARAIELLKQVEIPEPEARLGYYPHQLSGGQKQRVVLALALANDPVLLLADEPTTALDVTVQAEILKLLRRLRDETGAGILLVTHNMGVVAEMADRVVVLKTGDAVETAATGPLFAAPAHPYTRQLLAAVPRLPEPGDAVRLAERVAAGGEPTLHYENATVVYPGRLGQAAFRAVDSASLTVAPGEVLGLVGESGSGKTTLGRVAAGLVPLTEGSARIEGEDLATIGHARLREIRRDLAFVPQDPAASLDPRMTIADSISEPLDIHAVGDRGSRRARVAELLRAVRLSTEYSDRFPHELSGGQRQRIALARALALRPNLLIADEPTSALDVSVQAEVLALFAELQAELGFACLFISHDLAVIYEVADRVAVLRLGSVVESGPIGQVFGAPAHPYSRALIDAVPDPVPPAQATAHPTNDTRRRHGSLAASD
jgi:peptide/nickel transport system ATP-binding protein